MSLQINLLDLPAMPRNRSHMLTSNKGKPMNIKTDLCRHFEHTLAEMLLGHAEHMKKFLSKYDPKLHYISAEYHIFTPKDLLFTKEGRISQKSTDTDAHKTMRDVLYKSLGVDDKVERDTRFFTPVSHDDCWNYLIEMKLEPLWKLENMSSLILNTIIPEKDASDQYALL